MAETLVSSYEVLAQEYYNPVHHPTCANFREASLVLFRKWLDVLPLGRGWACEVGAGDSLLAEELATQGLQLNQLVLIDAAPTMLKYSSRWGRMGAHLVVGDAGMLELPSATLELLVSCLGDAYNTAAFWTEVSRALRPGGVALFTTPSHDWAMSFRSCDGRESLMTAEFALSDGCRLRLPSLIYPAQQQIALITESGLTVRDVCDIPISALKSSNLSPKLVLERGRGASVVSGFLVTKPNGHLDSCPSRPPSTTQV